MRVTDSLLPQIALDFHTTVGAAAIVVTSYAVTHGSIQFVAGPVGDRFGKYRTVAIAARVAAVLVAVCGIALSLPQLALARLATGAVAGWVIPISMAYVGDVTPARPAAADPGALRLRLHSRPVVRPGRRRRARRSVRLAQRLFRARRHVRAGGGRTGLRTHRRPANARSRPTERLAAARLRRRLCGGAVESVCARIVIDRAFIEGALAWGAFAYIGADLHLRFGLSFTLIGLTVACFGIGGLIYAGWSSTLSTGSARPASPSIGGLIHRRRLRRARNRSRCGGSRRCATTAIGLGFYMLHNTLQTNATQMTPEARGTAVALFSSALYFGQTAGVTVGAL